MTHPASRFRARGDAGCARGNRCAALRRPDEYSSRFRRTARQKTASRLRRAKPNENRAAVHAAWKLHFDCVRRVPRQRLLPGLGLASRRSCRRAMRPSIRFSSKTSTPRPQRLRNFVEKAAQATRIGQVFDDAAMAQGLLNYFLQAINCGALKAEEVESLTSFRPKISAAHPS